MPIPLILIAVGLFAGGTAAKVHRDSVSDEAENTRKKAEAIRSQAILKKKEFEENFVPKVAEEIELNIKALLIHIKAQSEDIISLYANFITLSDLNDNNLGKDIRVKVREVPMPEAMTRVYDLKQESLIETLNSPLTEQQRRTAMVASYQISHNHPAVGAAMMAAMAAGKLIDWYGKVYEERTDASQYEADQKVALEEIEKAISNQSSALCVDRDIAIKGIDKYKLIFESVNALIQPIKLRKPAWESLNDTERGYVIALNVAYNEIIAALTPSEHSKEAV